MNLLDKIKLVRKTLQTKRPGFEVALIEVNGFEPIEDVEKRYRAEHKIEPDNIVFMIYVFSNERIRKDLREGKYPRGK